MDIKNCEVKTQSRTKKKPTVSIKAYRNYIEQKEWIDHWVLGTASENNWSYWGLLFLCFFNREQWEHFNGRYKWKEIPWKNIQWIVIFFKLKYIYY